MRHPHVVGRSIVASALTVIFATACAEAPTSVHDHADVASVVVASDARISDLLKDVRRATARFHSTTQAVAAGYEPTDHCVAHPALGGMGYHWANPGLVDPVFDAAAPEVVLYERVNGTLRLVAIEYVVVNVGQPRPSFDGHDFDIGGAPLPVPHWTLHVWLFKDNPAGMFTPFNPDVSCD